MIPGAALPVVALAVVGRQPGGKCQQQALGKGIDIRLVLSAHLPQPVIFIGRGAEGYAMLAQARFDFAQVGGGQAVFGAMIAAGTS